MTLELRHYQGDPVEFDRSRVYEQGDDARRPFGKPHGFWVSVLGEDDWAEWCTRESFGNLTVEHEVILAPSANLLVIDSAAALLDFHRARRLQAYPGVREYWAIDWSAVAAMYDGIIIAPYQWAARRNLHWYSGWDCASGCVWNLDAIEFVSVLSSESVAS